MANKTMFRIKKERTNGVSSATESMFIEEPLENNNPCVAMKEEPGLSFDTGDSEDNNVEDQPEISESSESIKEDVELNLEAEETEDFADTNLQQFGVDQLEDSVKYERDDGAATLPSQHQHQSSMLLLPPSPPHHLLPPGGDTLSFYSPGQQCAGEHPKVVEWHRAEPERHPETPPVTPPANLSPTQLVSTAAMAAASALLEDMGLTAVHYRAQGGHDPHSTCTADNTMESVVAPVSLAASGTTEAVSSIANNCCKLSVDDASHHNLLHQHCEEHMPVQLLDAGPVSHTAYRSNCRQHRREAAPAQHATSTASSSKDVLNDDALVSLTVSELNLKLGGFPREEVVRLKRKRRALKNRGYAKTRQSKWLQKRRDLEITHRTLVAELKHVKTELVRISRERDLYKRYLGQGLCATIHASRSDATSSSTMVSPPDESLH